MTSPTPSITLTKSSSETLSNDDNAPQDLESGTKQKQLTSTKSNFVGKSTRKIAQLDANEDEGKAQFFLTLMYER